MTPEEIDLFKWYTQHIRETTITIAQPSKTQMLLAFFLGIAAGLAIALVIS